MEIRRTRSERGASLTEYAVLVAVIVVAAIPALGFLEGRAGAAFEEQAVAMEGGPASATPDPGPAPDPDPDPDPDPPANALPTAHFTATCAGLACQFTDASSDAEGPISSWAWSFDDGGTSTDQHPSRTYATAGTYTVTLVVTDAAGASDSSTTPVVFNAAPEADFEHSCNKLACAFTDRSTDDAEVTTWAWTFPGAVSETRDPTVTFTRAGLHQVTLLVTDAEGLTGTVTKSVSIPAVSVSLTGSGSRNGNSNNRTYTATVSATTSSGLATSGVVVQGTWSNGGGSGQCTTGGNGTCAIDLGVSGSNPGIRTFTPTAVTHWAWDGTVPGALTVAQPDR